VVVTARHDRSTRSTTLLDAQLPQGTWDTVGGSCSTWPGACPTEGEGVEVDGFRLVAERVQGRRIGRVRIERTGPVESAAEASA